MTHRPTAHHQVPADPTDGDEFTCARCGVALVYVDLNDGQPGEWVDVTPPEDETEPPTLTEFLLARIAEDRDAAKHAQWAMQGQWFTEADDKVDVYVQRMSPARVLAECEAKLRIVEEYETAELALTQPAWSDRIARERMTTCRDVLLGMLRILAAVYADHPDYRDEWRP